MRILFAFLRFSLFFSFFFALPTSVFAQETEETDLFSDEAAYEQQLACENQASVDYVECLSQMDTDFCMITAFEPSEIIGCSPESVIHTDRVTSLKDYFNLCKDELDNGAQQDIDDVWSEFSRICTDLDSDLNSGESNTVEYNNNVEVAARSASRQAREIKGMAMQDLCKSILAVDLYVCEDPEISSETTNAEEATDAEIRQYTSSFNNASSLETSSVNTQYQDILAQGIIFAGICDSSDADCECRDYGICSVQDILQVFVNMSIFILGISGTVLLVMFIYGGTLWLLSQGKSDQVQKGKDTLIGAVVGLVIIFGAYTAINLLVGIMTKGEIPDTALEETIGGNASSIIQTTTD